MADKICGIYCIENKVNGKKYIGKGKNIKSRWSDHKGKLDKKAHPNNYLQNSWDKYGKENFDFYIIKECHKENLDSLEIYYIKELNTRCPFGYNLTSGGGGLLDVKHSEESILKMSQSKMGHSVSEETRKKLSLSNKNKPRNFSSEYKERLRMNFTGENNPNYGKPLNEETKKKMIETKRRIFEEKRIERNIIKKTKKQMKEERGCSSSLLGVSFSKQKNKWRAYHLAKHIGYYDSELEAGIEHDKECWRIFGDLKKLNFPDDYILLEENLNE